MKGLFSLVQENDALIKGILDILATEEYRLHKKCGAVAQFYQRNAVLWEKYVVCSYLNGNLGTVLRFRFFQEIHLEKARHDRSRQKR